ncbi:hypothetical protein PAPYR_1059 [Paratrimastix pyriformis]|uniref:Cyclin N-terminal domain-containing protein n=1 Tax=Paratrimastix pyriformis TaxID=342808 RepID=A0ABQ8UYG1_9EUKA|nr:hypothetical protein PAPYR_1059 [Paratrimastix pyriformis]|eukprot:GAFH01001515.1.p1 GENE.GAFH01001515.1~~GAFH01001515.1.p1  ORF type:complete len:373 (-),score=46.64 GAFH01001515.1:428-1546(-)
MGENSFGLDELSPLESRDHSPKNEEYYQLSEEVFDQEADLLPILTTKISETEPRLRPSAAYVKQAMFRPDARRNAVVFILQATKALGRSFHVADLAVRFMDRFCSKSEISDDTLPLALGTFLLLASKQLDVEIPLSSLLNLINADLDQPFSTDEACFLEQLVGSELEMDCADTSSSLFLKTFETLLNQAYIFRNRSNRSVISEVAVLFLESIIPDPLFLEYTPATQALAALLCAHSFLLSPESARSQMKKLFTSRFPRELDTLSVDACARAMTVLFCRIHPHSLFAHRMGLVPRKVPKAATPRSAAVKRPLLHQSPLNIVDCASPGSAAATGSPLAPHKPANLLLEPIGEVHEHLGVVTSLVPFQPAVAHRA